MKRAKNARAARYLKAKEPKVVEDEKHGLFLRAAKTSERSLEALRDLYALKKPAAQLFSRKNAVRPFEDETSLEFLCDKNDAAVCVVASHSKKRPHNLVFCRIFDGHVLDKIEVGLDAFVGVDDHRALFSAARTNTTTGSKPAFVFEGADFENDLDMRLLKSMLLDLFRGAEVDAVSLAGLERVIVCTAVAGKCYFRHYSTAFSKSGQSRAPRVDLVPAGPSMDMSVRRVQHANPDVEKIALKRPKLAKKKHVKNVGRNAFSDKVGRLHMGNQDLDKLQLRKVKALKKGAPPSAGAGASASSTGSKATRRKRKRLTGQEE
jgi:ribosome production factor 2